MNCKKLMQNIMDVIAEEQIKLGFRSEVIYLYYPLKSLNSLLGTDSDIYEMKINLSVSKHGCTIEDILGVFGKYSGNVTVKKIEDGEFDYLIYFTDGKPNDYRYCIKFEGCHASYHRFTKDDYLSLGIC